MKAWVVIISFVIIVGLLIWFVLVPEDNPISSMLNREKQTQPNVLVTPVPKEYNIKEAPPLINKDVPGIIMCNALYEMVKNSCQ